MSLFGDTETADAPADPNDKNRLFETHSRAGRSKRGYLQLFGLVVAAVVVVGGIVVFLTMPGTGDEVRAPRGLEDAVKNHFLESEKRSVIAATFYSCGDSYSARVNLENRPDIKARSMDEGHRHVVATEDANGRWSVRTIATEPKEPGDNCPR